jgi:hypothetical protein
MSDGYENRAVKIMTTDNLIAHGYASLTSMRDSESVARMNAQVERYATEIASRGEVGEALQLMAYARVAGTWPYVIAWGAHPDRSTDYVTPLGNRYPRVIPTAMPAEYDIMTGRMRGEPAKRSRARRVG